VQRDTITIDMRASAFDAYLVLLDPSDVPVAENDDAATSTGTWTVVANSLAAAGSGDYTLSISCPGAAVRCGGGQCGGDRFGVRRLSPPHSDSHPLIGSSFFFASAALIPGSSFFDQASKAPTTSASSLARASARVNCASAGRPS